MATDGIHSGVTSIAMSMIAFNAYLFVRVVDAVSKLI